MAGKGRGKRLTDSERMEIITRLEAPDQAEPLSRAKCARLYGVTPAAISKLMKVSQTVKKRYSDAGADNGGLRDKRQRGGFSKNVRFEDELYQWICSVRARKVPLLVSHVQQKAKLLATKHNLNKDFKASNGWYYRFCARHGLAPAALHTGVASAKMDASGAAPGISEGVSATTAIKTDDTETAQKLALLRDQVALYGPESVYTVSEARLFYQLLPSHLRPPKTPTASPATGQPTASHDSNAVDATSGKMARVLVLVCANGTGTHKVPLLVVGKERAPSSFGNLHPQLLRDVTMQADGSSDANSTTHGSSSGTGDAAAIGVGVGVGEDARGTSYFSQREVWCDDRTFQHWCDHVFMPAIRRHTTRPVLLIAENPGAQLTPFQRENVSTVFLPLRTTVRGLSSVASGPAGELNGQSGVPSQQQTLEAKIGAANGHGNVQFQPLHCGVVQDLKRRYKVAVVQEMLSFLEKPDDERFRLLQRAMKKPAGSAGIAFGRPPHLLDAMSLLDEVWADTPASLVRSCWVQANLGPMPLMPSSMTAEVPFGLQLSDEMVVLELCSMVRNVTMVEDMNMLAKELRQWLCADDDSSERMQQELLHDIQQLLQEEGKKCSTDKEQLAQKHTQPQPHSQAQTQQTPQQQQLQEVLHQRSFQQQLQLEQNSSTFMDPAGGMHLGTSFADPHYPDSGSQQPQQSMGPSVVLREKHKAISFALHALSTAEEALDNASVTEYFGEPAAGQAMESITRALRRLRRVQRGKQSALMAAVVNANANASTSSASSNSASSIASNGANASSSSNAANMHAYFYGKGALGDSQL